MNQQPMQSQQPAVSKWLWIVLVIVIIAGGAFFAWYYLMGPGKAVKSSTLETNQTTAQTATAPNSNNSTPISTAPNSTDNSTTTTTTSTPPDGWKLDNSKVTSKNSSTGAVNYSLYIKNNWNKTADLTYGYQVLYWADQTQCDNYGPKYGTCSLRIDIGDGAPANKDENTFITPNQKGYVTLIFGSNITDAEKKIIRDSFKF